MIFAEDVEKRGLSFPRLDSILLKISNKSAAYTVWSLGNLAEKEVPPQATLRADWL